MRWWITRRKDWLKVRVVYLVFSQIGLFQSSTQVGRRLFFSQQATVWRILVFRHRSSPITEIQVGSLTHLFLFYLLSHLWEYLPIFSDKRRCFAAFLPILRIFESTMWKISQSPKLMFSTAFSSEMSHMARTAPLMFCEVIASQYVSTRDGMIPVKKESELNGQGAESVSRRRTKIRFRLSWPGDPSLWHVCNKDTQIEIFFFWFV